MINNIVQAINEQAHLNPDKIVYEYLGSNYTYHELDLKSDNVAAYLSGIGVEDQSPIMVYGGQTFDMLVAFLGCLKAGHAYIPVDVNSSDERVRTILETANPKLIVQVADLPIHTMIKTIDHAKLDEIYRLPSLGMTLKPVNDDDNVYIIFTSGTTGKPKGVQISENNLRSFVDWMINDFDFANCDTLLQPPYSFDLSVMALYPTLVSGGTLRVLPQKILNNFQDMFLTLSKLSLQNWVSTPSFVEMCLLDPFFNAKRYPELQQFFFCGEELTSKTARKLMDRFPDAHIYNTYGPTESTVAVTSIEITNQILDKYERLPIGIVKPDTTVLIDRKDNEHEGEIVIKGPGVSKGYLNNPEKTKRSFIVEKAGDNDAYHTGDIGYFEKNILFYNGRSDFQIKMNGYRIELEEINYYISKILMVDKGVVVPRYDRDHKVHQLIAFIKLNKNTGFMDETQCIQEVRKELSTDIMPYMMPQRFVLRQDLPISPNGKVDIKALISEVNNNA